MDIYVKLVFVVLLALCSPVVGLLTLRFVRRIRALLSSFSLQLESFEKTILSEVNDLKFKTVDSARQKVVSQTFTPYRKDYVLDPSTNELEELPIPKNVQEFIQSHIECALERVMERFLPSKDVQDDDKLVADYTERLNDLGVLGEAMDLAEDYREKYNLSDDMSVRDVYVFVANQASDLKFELSKLNRVKEEKKDEA